MHEETYIKVVAIKNPSSRAVLPIYLKGKLVICLAKLRGDLHFLLLNNYYVISNLRQTAAPPAYISEDFVTP
jgi:hypothetical protein